MTAGIYRNLDDINPEERALNRGLFFGESPFTTMKMVDGNIFGLDLHMTRLEKCVEYLFSVDFLSYKNSVLELIEKAKEDKGSFYLRVTFTKTLSGKIDFFLYKDHYQANNSPICLALSKVIKGRGILPSFLKVGNYLEYSRELSEREDCNELVYEDFDGNILESGVSNIFIVNEKVVYTPRLRSGVLDGVMRQTLIQFLAKENLAFKEVDFSKDLLETCSEIWLTNGLRGVRVVEKYHDMNLSSAYWESLSVRFNEFCEKL